MNNFEFWKDMDKIFDAIVAYQEKTIEFNKRFINPWVNLGNVFDKKESNEAIATHKNAIEIDPENAQSWYELAGTYTRSGNFEESIQAYQKAIELGFESGDLYKNMALAYAMTARHQEAIPFFEKALKLSDNEKDKAVIWNHLGNVYRKMDNYEQALHAFQYADQLECAQSPILEQQTSVEIEEQLPNNANYLEEDISASQTNDVPATVMEEDFLPDETEMSVDNFDLEAEQDNDLDEDDSEDELETSTGDEFAPSITDEHETQEEEQDQNDDDDIPVIFEMDFTEKHLEEHSIPAPSSAAEEADELTVLEPQLDEHEIGVVTAVEKSVVKVMSASDDAESPASNESAQEALVTEENAPEKGSVSELISEMEKDEALFSVDTDQDDNEIEESVSIDEENDEFPFESEEVNIQNSLETDPEPEETASEEVSITETVPAFEDDSEPDLPLTADEDDVDENDIENFQVDQIAVQIPTIEQEVNEKIYEEELKVNVTEDTELASENDSMTTFLSNKEHLRENQESINANLSTDQSVQENTITRAPIESEVTNSEVNVENVGADQTVDMDTKNAHVWNELGNVYFNAGSFDDAITAYIKAIELDRQFAWPYTNLAMAYVQKGRLEEAVLLYQRSLELLSNEKDKAVTWNRLGNLYRRMDDYENAISAYQRADDLDPGNTTITNQTKFSLLGSEKIEQEVGYSL